MMGVSGKGYRQELASVGKPRDAIFQHGGKDSIVSLKIEQEIIEQQIDEIKNLYQESYSNALEQQARAFWFHRMAVELARPQHGWRRWLPYWIVGRRIERRLKRLGLFDADRYASRYPDVVQSRNEPVHHFLQHGLAERREGGPDFKAAHLPRTGSSVLPLLLSSGLFDPDWYARTYKLQCSPMELLQNYLEKSTKDPLCEPGPLFSGSFYRAENPDTVSIHPLEHYVLYGMREGRRAFKASRADRFMADENSTPLPSLSDFLSIDKKVTILYWADGNFFFKDIAQYIAEVVQSSGREANLKTDHTMIDVTEHDVIVVAPHEYCVHGPGADLPDDLAQRVIYINTEQWHTSWFSLALDKMLKSKRALDINPLSAHGLARMGIKAGFVPLLPRPDGVFDFKQAKLSPQVTHLRAVKPLVFPPSFADRPYDILFAGALNERRAQVLATLAPTLAKYDCFLHAPRLRGVPVTPDSPNMINGSDLAQLARNSKILLNIHQGESHYFEWHRIVVSGIAQGCVPLSEPCSDIEIVKPGEHYISVCIEEMADRMAWLLDTPAGQRELNRIHQNGRELMVRMEKM
ncbi:hypothetical protein [Sphingobium sp. B2]|uniref:hypothetical protein n=1 Tax=Sphingobium sp. B2 TaxID=2583228 RepID=UPI0011A41CFD|nr:hypothetical protein [Sphingobium sp. B2]